MTKRIVIAFGGNAILQKGQEGTFCVQLDNVYTACEQVAQLIEAGYEVVITHGNGPQVGAMLLQNEEGADVTPPMPLFACGAQTQGLIGYMIQQALGNVLQRKGLKSSVVTLVTQVLVPSDDPGFLHPTKPIGPYYSQDKARELSGTKGWVLVEDQARGGWRRVVASPDPYGIKESPIILKLLEAGSVVIASGGGGIPVIETEAGLKGVDAVIDKDLAGQVLAQDINAHVFCILSDVEQAAIHFGQVDEVRLGDITLTEAHKYFQEGHFAAGSMGPKMQAAMRFVERGGERAIITSLAKALEGIKGNAGTVISHS